MQLCVCVLFIYIEFQNSTIVNRKPILPSTTTSTPIPSTTVTVNSQYPTQSAHHSLTTATDTLLTTIVTTSVVDLSVTATAAYTITQSVDHTGSSVANIIDAFITADVTTIATKSADLSITAVTNPANTITTFTNSPTLSTSQPDSNSTTSQSSGVVQVAVAVVLVVVFVTITIVVVGVIVICYKRKRSKRYTEQEGADCSTIDKKALQKPPTTKLEPVYFEFEGPNSINTKGIHSITQVHKAIKQDPYSIPFDNQLKKKQSEVKIQDNPAYSVSSEVNMRTEADYCYVDTACYRNDT